MRALRRLAQCLRTRHLASASVRRRWVFSVVCTMMMMMTMMTMMMISRLCFDPGGIAPPPPKKTHHHYYYYHICSSSCPWLLLLPYYHIHWRFLFVFLLRRRLKCDCAELTQVHCMWHFSACAARAAAVRIPVPGQRTGGDGRQTHTQAIRLSSTMISIFFSRVELGSKALQDGGELFFLYMHFRKGLYGLMGKPETTVLLRFVL